MESFGNGQQLAERDLEQVERPAAETLAETPADGVKPKRPSGAQRRKGAVPAEPGSKDAGVKTALVNPATKALIQELRLRLQLTEVEVCEAAVRLLTEKAKKAVETHAERVARLAAL